MPRQRTRPSHWSDCSILRSVYEGASERAEQQYDRDTRRNRSSEPPPDGSVLISTRQRNIRHASISRLRIRYYIADLEKKLITNSFSVSRLVGEVEDLQRERDAIWSQIFGLECRALVTEEAGPSALSLHLTHSEFSASVPENSPSFLSFPPFNDGFVAQEMTIVDTEVEGPGNYASSELEDDPQRHVNLFTLYDGTAWHDPLADEDSSSEQ